MRAWLSILALVVAAHAADGAASAGPRRTLLGSSLECVAKNAPCSTKSGVPRCCDAKYVCTKAGSQSLCKPKPTCVANNAACSPGALPCCSASYACTKANTGSSFCKPKPPPAPGCTALQPNGRCPTNDSGNCLYPWKECSGQFASCQGAVMQNAPPFIQRCNGDLRFNFKLQNCANTCDNGPAPPKSPANVSPPPKTTCTALQPNGHCPTNDSGNCLYPWNGCSGQFANCQGAVMQNAPPIIQSCNTGQLFNFKAQNCLQSC
eukprot:scaffold19.g1813.t1